MDVIYKVVLFLYINSVLTQKIDDISDLVLIDTDAGVDDAIGILLALNYEKYNSMKVIGITAVHGNTDIDNVVSNVFKTLKTIERLDIPVYRGMESSIIENPPGDNYYGADGFGDTVFENPPKIKEFLKEEHAVDVMIRLSLKYPNKITLITLGPLTNVAFAARKDPSFLGRLKSINILGGSFEGMGNVQPGMEFNMYMDPEAIWIVLDSISKKKSQPARILYNEVFKYKTFVPMEWRTSVLGRISSAEIDLMNRMERNLLKGSGWSSADSQMVAAVLNPVLVTKKEEVFVDVSIHADKTRGFTIADYRNKTRNPSNAVLLQELDVEGYKNFLFDLFS